MTLFNEANLINILETSMFHEAASESLGDAAVDLADYAVRQLTRLASEMGECKENAADGTERKGPKWSTYDEIDDWTPGEPIPKMKNVEPHQELESQAQTTRFQVGCRDRKSVV